MKWVSFKSICTLQKYTFCPFLNGDSYDNKRMGGSMSVRMGKWLGLKAEGCDVNNSNTLLLEYFNTGNLTNQKWVKWSGQKAFTNSSCLRREIKKYLKALLCGKQSDPGILWCGWIKPCEKKKQKQNNNNYI